nr:xylulose kinase 7938 [Schizochytrium sp.]
MGMRGSKDVLYLGIDAGTQSIKASVYDGAMQLVEERAVKFDEELPQYGTRAGMIVEDEAAGVVRSPVFMWVEALEIALERLAQAVDMSSIVAVSGSAQQHSSVWWRAFPASFDPNERLVEQLRAQKAFSTELSPIWADSSTSEEVKSAEGRVGGAAAMQQLTGSVGTERFTGNQIARMAKRHPEIYKDTERVMLLSTALTSLFLGRPAATEAGDAAGMNMMQLDKNVWLDDLEDVFDAPGLADKAGDLCEANANLGAVSDFMVKRFGFSPSCQVAAFTGDNLATLVGCVDRANDVIVSLGTSDTVLSQQPTRKQVNQAALVFPHPTDQALYMIMICYKNGGAVRNDEKGEDHKWSEVDEILLADADENEPDVICIFFPHKEIAPRPMDACERAFRIDNGEEVDVASLSWRQRVRGVILARALSIKTHLEDCKSSYDRVVITGGGSNSKGIPAVFRQVLGVPVFTSQQADGASRGAALKAMLAVDKAPKGHAILSERPEAASFAQVPATDLYRKIEAQL